MNTWPWDSPDATRQGLRDRLRDRYTQREIPLRLTEVAFRRLLARLDTADPSSWVVKGGVALILRLDPSRTSNDIDLAFPSAELDHSAAILALERAFEIDLGDFFAFEFANDARGGVPEIGDGTVSLRVIARIGQRDWSSFEIDLARPAAVVPSEALELLGALTGIEAVDAVTQVRVFPIALQLAEKACAMFERHGTTQQHSTRARDLVDVAMVAQQIDQISGDSLADGLELEELRRLDRGSLVAPLPDRFALHPVQESDWRRRWARATRDAPMTYDVAHAIAGQFLTPVLARSVRGRRWAVDRRSWI
jgi:hypothetical protein